MKKILTTHKFTSTANMAQLTAAIIDYIVKMHCTLLSFLSSYRKQAQQTLSVFGKLGLVQHLVLTYFTHNK